MKRVLVLGPHGMLGSALVAGLRQAGFEVSALARPQFDARTPDFAQIATMRPDAVVNSIGLINRHLNLPEADFMRVNSIFPRRLADWCQSNALPLIHVSTDCVFRGAHGPYDEAATGDATDPYGQSKAWGEPANALVLRTSIIGPELRNHYSLLCWFLAQTEAVHGFQNHLWNGVTTLELSRVIAVILTQSLWQPGLRHIHGEDLCKFDLLRLIQAAYGTATPIIPWQDATPRDTRLRTRHHEFLAALRLKPMAEQLRQVLAVSDRRGHWRTASGNF